MTAGQALSVRILAALILFPPAASSADALVKLPMLDKQDIRFTRISVDWGGLPRSIFAIAQDRYGFLWLGTRVGLYRYDGYNLKPFRHERDDPNSPSDDNIRSVYKDRAGILWIGTGFGGLDRLDPSQDTFTHYRHDPNDGRSLGGNTVSSVYEDRGGALWVATDGGLDRLDPVSRTFLHYRHDPHDAGSLSDNSVLSIFEDRQGNLWVGTAMGLNRLNRATGRFTAFHHDAKDIRGPVLDDVSAILEDRSGALWVASQKGGGLRVLDVTTGKFTQYSVRSEKSGDPGFPSINSIQEDAAGQLWMGTTDYGLLKLDRERKEFVRYRNDPTNPNSLHHDLVQAIFQDAEGAMWVCAGAGISRFPTKPLPFVNYHRDSDSRHSLSDNFIRSVHMDSQGTVWVGSNVLQRLDRSTGQFAYYPHYPDRDSMSDDFVSAIGESQTGALWFGTLRGGINRFDRTTERFFAYRHNPNDGSSLSSDTVFCLLIDRQGVLWVGTDSGLNRFDPTTGHFTVYRNHPENAHSLSHDTVQVIFEDRAGVLWLGSLNGLNRFEPKTGQFTVYRHSPGDPRSLSHNQVNAIREDRRGALWIGTQNGLDRMDRSGAILATFGRKDGLPESAIKAILEDQQGYLWLATPNGLSRFDPQIRTFRNYSESDGLPSNLLNPGWESGSYRTPSGEILVGSMNGLTTFYPNRLPPPYVPRVLLTDFLLYNKPVRYSGKSPLRKGIWATDSLTLNHGQSIFTLEFAALSYQSPERNRYRYRLEGLETDWNEVDSKRSRATYTSLSSGDYVFHLQASNNNGVWNEKGVDLAITILPPWWATWWFRSIFVLSLVGIAWGAHRSRVRILQAGAARLEVQVAQRTGELSEKTQELQIAKDAAEAANRAKSLFLASMSHELRTPLNAILGFSRMLREGDVSEEQRKDLDIINRSGEHLLSLINDVLDVAKIEAGRKELQIAPCELSSIVRDVMNIKRVRAKGKDVTLADVQSPEVPRYILADASKLRQVLINLLGNAIKHTERGSVTLRLDARPTDQAGRLLLTFSVEDTGIGIAAEDQARIFEPFVQVGNQMAQPGTGLGLTITRQFVELMGGTIGVESTPGKGSRFWVELPVEWVQEFDVMAPGPEGEGIIGLAPDEPEYRVLIVEDQWENRIVLERLLQNAGFQVRVAADGAAGVDLFQTWRPHFIWMDLRMPVMDGIQATELIRALEGGREVKIAAATASVFADERDAVLAAGLDDFVRKPYRPGEIFDCMARLLGVRYRHREAALTSNGEPAAVLRPEALAALPEELRADLRDALMTLDKELIDQVIARVSQCDAALGVVLARIAEHLAYTAMLKAVRATL